MSLMDLLIQAYGKLLSVSFAELGAEDLERVPTDFLTKAEQFESVEEAKKELVDRVGASVVTALDLKKRHFLLGKLVWYLQKVYHLTANEMALYVSAQSPNVRYVKVRHYKE